MEGFEGEAAALGAPPGDATAAVDAELSVGVERLEPDAVAALGAGGNAASVVETAHAGAFVSSAASAKAIRALQAQLVQARSERESLRAALDAVGGEGDQARRELEEERAAISEEIRNLGTGLRNTVEALRQSEAARKELLTERERERDEQRQREKELLAERERERDEQRQREKEKEEGHRQQLMLLQQQLQLQGEKPKLIMSSCSSPRKRRASEKEAPALEVQLEREREAFAKQAESLRRAKAAAETRAAEAEATLQSVLKMSKDLVGHHAWALRAAASGRGRGPAEPQHQLPSVLRSLQLELLDADAAHAEALDAKAQGDSGDLGAVADAEMLEVSQFMRRKGAEVGALRNALKQPPLPGV